MTIQTLSAENQDDSQDEEFNENQHIMDRHIDDGQTNNRPIDNQQIVNQLSIGEILVIVDDLETAYEIISAKLIATLDMPDMLFFGQNRFQSTKSCFIKLVDTLRDLDKYQKMI